MKSTYLLLPIGILALVFYFFTLLLSRFSVLKLSTHRKIWNVLLLLTFLSTAILGLILAIQVNYKLQIPFIGEILKYHVNFGIGMTIVAIFHFLWHWNYYKKLLSAKNKTSTDTAKIITTESEILIQSRWGISLFPVFVLGFSAIITQIVILRELISVFNGNELITGIILALWMLLTGFGAYSGRLSNQINHKTGLVVFLLVLTGILPLINLFLIHYLKNIIFIVGTSQGLIQIFFSVLVILAPICFISGFFFTLLTGFANQSKKKFSVAGLYAIESIGSMAGGLLFSLILIRLLSTFQILSVLVLINSIIALLLLFYFNVKNRVTKFILVLAALLVGVLVYFIKPDHFSRHFLFPNQELVYFKETPLGNLSITSTADQFNFYENNVLLFTTENTIKNEETVHYVMVQHKCPREILLLSGGIAGTTNEILKYNVNRIDYVELNPWLLQIADEYTENLKNKRIHPIVQDARLFVKLTSNRYDIIIIDLPPPENAQLNRYYTLDFFKELKTCMHTGAIGSLSLPAFNNYQSDESIDEHSIIFKTLNQVFKHVLIVPGEKTYYLFSDAHLTINIPQRIAELGVTNQYVNQYYIDELLLKQKSLEFLNNLKPDVPINTDFKPVAYFKNVKIWLSQFHSSSLLVLVIFVLVTIVFIVISKLNVVNLNMFSAGFTGSAIEVILLLSIQVLYGYIYQMIGFIIALFMVGLAIGAAYGNKLFKNPGLMKFRIILLLFISYILILAALLPLLKKINLDVISVHIIFSILTLVISILVGIVFYYSSQFQNNSPVIAASRVYSIDLIGAALGALLVSIIFIPIVGIISTILLLGGLNLITLMLTFVKN
ncbi:MAG: fused MFS/spermidine synthase [Bacteroidales bacterium]|nr:fused MFS/spermidine synthase [Bacteroidales bacterium]